jgi:hypothetical protein
MEIASRSAVSPACAWSPQIVRVPVRTTLYRQAMAENGQGDRPQPLGPALPSGYVCYAQ